MAKTTTEVNQVQGLIAFLSAAHKRIIPKTMATCILIHFITNYLLKHVWGNVTLYGNASE